MRPPSECQPPIDWVWLTVINRKWLSGDTQVLVHHLVLNRIILVHSTLRRWHPVAKRVDPFGENRTYGRVNTDRDAENCFYVGLTRTTTRSDLANGYRYGDRWG